MAEVRIPKSVSRDEFLNQIRCGVHDALIELARAGSSNLGGALFDAIRDGIREAVKATVREHEATTARQDTAAESGPESTPRTETEGGA